MFSKFSKLDTQPIFPPVYASLDTLQRPVQNSGPSGSLLLSRKALSSSIPCRFIPAHHHIFFPPRLEVVVEQQNPNCLPSHLRPPVFVSPLLRPRGELPSGRDLLAD